MINRKYQRERSFSFITIAFLTLSSPGPGVLFTVTNSINYGVRTALFGISGLIIGMFIIAVISASGVGLIITSNPTIFTAEPYRVCRRLNILRDYSDENQTIPRN